jgi:hypothetical protein
MLWTGWSPHHQAHMLCRVALQQQLDDAFIVCTTPMTDTVSTAHTFDGEGVPGEGVRCK